jgi:multidrug efflux system outer membrane protein
VGAAEANLRDVLLSLLSEIARNYFEYRGALVHLEVARKNAQVQEETLKLTVVRFEGGRGTELDVSRARAELKSTLALIPPIEGDAAQGEEPLAVLLGPAAVGLRAGPGALSDRLPSLVAIGKPEDLLRRRPGHPRGGASPRGLDRADRRRDGGPLPARDVQRDLRAAGAERRGLFQSGAAAYTFAPVPPLGGLRPGRVAARIRARGCPRRRDLEALRADRAPRA